MHKYNNQDHSMYTAMLTVENILGADHDIWSVNVEAEYHEQKAAEGPEDGGTGRDAPVLSRDVVDAARESRMPVDHVDLTTSSVTARPNDLPDRAPLDS
jgi:hypothetical protein